MPLRRLLVLFVFVGGLAWADEPPRPPTPEQAADAVLAALVAKDDAALQTLAAKDDPDPWLVADELIRRGEHDAAEGFAKAAPRVDVEGLPAYVASRRGMIDDPARRERLAKVNAALQAGKPADALEALGGEEPGSIDDVVAVRLAMGRGLALEALVRLGESAAATAAAGDVAERLGWLLRAQVALKRAGQTAYRGSAFVGARAAWERVVALCERRGDKAEAANTLGNIGNVYRALGDYDKALATQERALAAHEAQGNEAGVATTLVNIGAVYRALGDYEKALAALERALAAHEALGNRTGVANTLQGLGNVHYVRGDFAEALAIYERTLAAQEALGNKAGATVALGSIGNLHFARGDFAKALATYEVARAAMEALGDKAGAAKWLNNIASGHYALGNHAEALATYERALAAKEAMGDSAGVAETLVSIGLVHFARGDFAEALAIYERALPAQDALGDKAGSAHTLGAIGSVYGAWGDYASALAAWERALAAMERLGDKAGAARTMTNIGNVHDALGDFAKALAVHERALAAMETLGDKWGAAKTVSSIGNVHYALGNYGMALATYERALGAQETMGDKGGAATTLGNLGNIYLVLGDHARALATYERALAAKEALGDRVGAATTLGNIGSVLYMLGDYAQALAVLERALAAKETLGDQVGAAATLGNIGNVHVVLGEYARALATHERALAVQEALGDRAGVARTLSNIGLTQERLGDLKAARATLERAVRGARRLRAVPVLVEALRGLADLHLSSGAPSRALAAAREALRESESLLGGLGEEDGALARQAQGALYELGTLAAVREEDPAEALAFLESGRAGALLDALEKREMLRWRAETLPEELRTALQKATLAERHARLEYEKTLKGEDRNARVEAARVLDEALEEGQAVHMRIQRENKRAAGLFYSRARSLEEIQASLQPGEVLVLYGLCLKEALALVVEPEGERLVALGTREEAEEACAALALNKPDVDPSAALATLRRLLVDPLALGEGVKQVLVSPEGPLCFLPWGALLDQPVAVTPSGSTHALLREEERAPGEGVLALGDPDYAGASPGAQAIYYRGRTLSVLPATRREVESVSTVALLGADASEDGLRAALLKQKRWRAVHFACHGLIDARRPGLSALALSRAGEQDGFLTALEVLRMQVPADLAVLSACETGTGKLVGGEGIVGLTRAFMYAGTPRVICSLWKVDDDATAALMTRFYALWMPKDGAPRLSAAEALREAQAFVRSREKWKHPYYWAAWVLWGLPE